VTIEAYSLVSWVSFYVAMGAVVVVARPDVVSVVGHGQLDAVERLNVVARLYVAVARPDVAAVDVEPHSIEELVSIFCS
jgi:hypothetical protein